MNLASVPVAELRRLVELAIAVRTAQRAYFRRRDPVYLERAKALERQFDHAVADTLRLPPVLFDPHATEADGVEGGGL